MATNLNIDEKLLAEALKVGGMKTKRETVNAALAEYIQRRKQREVLKVFGTIDFDSSYDHKAARRAR
jgi:Arc/MetJ family transcription regulator